MRELIIDDLQAVIYQRVFLIILFAAVCAAGAGSGAAAATALLFPDLSKYEGGTVASVEVVIEEAARDSATEAEFRSLLKVEPGSPFSAVLVRESLQALFDTNRVVNARVEAIDAGGQGADGRGRVGLRFVVRPQVLVGEVVLDLGVATAGVPISEDELRARLNLLEPGKRVSEQLLRNNADAIQVYLRDQGFYRANVEYDRRLNAAKTRATIVYRITLGEQTRVENFNIAIDGFAPQRLRPDLKLSPAAPFTQTALADDVSRIRQVIIAEGHLAPQLDEPDLILDSARNLMTINLRGAVGPKVSVEVQGYDDLSDNTERELLPVRREGSLDPAAIEEGARRLRNRLQEEGYFFAEVTPQCAVVPPLAAPAPAAADDGIEAGLVERTCDNLIPDELSGRAVNIVYEVERGRRFKLDDIRIEGTDKLTIEDVEDDLRTTKAGLFGFLPLIGNGRGYTSDEALIDDQRTIEARLRELGYRDANVVARRGVSLAGENLIVTFVVTEGQLTRVAGVAMRGNQIYTAERLRDAACPPDRLPDELCIIEGGPFARTQARAAAERLRNFYARDSYLEAKVDFDFVELPVKNGDKQVRIIYTIDEGQKVFINRIFINGNVRTSREAILEAVPLREGAPLRADNLAESERILLIQSDAFRQVIIRREPAGETASGFRQSDVIIDVEEKKPIVMDYGGGFSTDTGPLGLFEIRNTNLFGELRQGAIRTRASRRLQTLRFEYFDPRFRSYNESDFAPLTVSVQYQSDSTVTRFFRSTIDRGNFGIVQRLDEEGKPIDVNCVALNCEPVSAPRINRFTINAETQRDFELETGPQGRIRKRSTLFLRYNYEDVRLFNINSLLIQPILQPDRVVRLSRLGASFARDTRDSQFDPTRGAFLTADYALALKQLGGNLSFSKFLTTYRQYYKFERVRPIVLAASIQLGLASIYNPRDRNDDGRIDMIDQTLPISERFFSGGSTTLRGFDFEEAGPRQAVVPPPGVVFRNNDGDPVTLNPFLVPVGGNALAVVNLEARIGIAKNVQVVPFYDGGNVFRRAGDIFGRELQEGEDPNLRAKWTHTIGLGFRIKTPFGPIAVDYAYLLNPPEFLLPQATGIPAIIRPARGQLHFRFGQAF